MHFESTFSDSVKWVTRRHLSTRGFDIWRLRRDTDSGSTEAYDINGDETAAVVSTLKESASNGIHKLRSLNICEMGCSFG